MAQTAIVSYGAGLRSVRQDAQPNCSSGNQPCGQICIPADETCRITEGRGKKRSHANRKLSRNEKILNMAGTASGIYGTGRLVALAAGQASKGRKKRQKGKSEAKGEKTKEPNKQNAGSENAPPSATKREEKKIGPVNQAEVKKAVDDFDDFLSDFLDEGKEKPKAEGRLEAELEQERKKREKEGKMDSQTVISYGGYLDQLRRDTQPNCSSGNQPCGEICIPADATCHVEGGGGKKRSHAKRKLSRNEKILRTASGIYGTGKLVALARVASKGRKKQKTSATKRPENQAEVKKAVDDFVAADGKASKGRKKQQASSTKRPENQAELAELKKAVDDLEDYLSDDFLDEGKEKPKAEGRLEAEFEQERKKREKERKMDSRTVISYGGDLDQFRWDAQPNCSSGNQPCGEICIPADATCRIEGGGGKKRGMGAGAKIGAGVAGVAGLAAIGAAATPQGRRLAKKAGKKAGALGEKAWKKGVNVTTQGTEKALDLAASGVGAAKGLKNKAQAKGSQAAKKGVGLAYRTKEAVQQGADKVKGAAQRGADKVATAATGKNAKERKLERLVKQQERKTRQQIRQAERAAAKDNKAAGKAAGVMDKAKRARDKVAKTGNDLIERGRKEVEGRKAKKKKKNEDSLVSYGF